MELKAAPAAPARLCGRDPEALGWGAGRSRSVEPRRGGFGAGRGVVPAPRPPDSAPRLRDANHFFSTFFTSSSTVLTWAFFETHLPSLPTMNRLGSTCTP